MNNSELFNYSTIDGKVTITGLNDKTIPEHLVVPSTIDGCPVVAVGEDAFSNANLTHVSMPSVLEIGKSAFHCSTVVSVDAPNVKTICDFAFKFCNCLKTVKLDEVTSLGVDAFALCYTMTGVYAPKCEEIENSAFFACNMITEIKTSSDYDDKSQITDITKLNAVILDSLSVIHKGAFSICGELKTAKLPNVKTIHQGAFSDCMKLEYVSFPSVREIHTDAFGGCSILNTISVPNVERIYPGAFNTTVIESFDDELCMRSYYAKGDTSDYRAEKLCKLDIQIADDNPNYVIENDFIMNRDKTEVVLYLGDDKEVNLPDTVTKICGCAFFCSRIEKITGKNVTTVGDSAFFCCSNLKVIQLCAVTELADCAFANCISLKKYCAPNLTSIPCGAFKYCKMLKEVVVMSVTEIGERGFEECKELKTVKAPELVKIGKEAFLACKSLTVVAERYEDVKYEATIAEKLVEIGDSAFCNSGMIWIEAPRLKSMSKRAFEGCRILLTVRFENLAPDGFGGGAFGGCKDLKYITLNNDAFTVDGGAIYNKDKTKLLSYLPAKGHVVLPETVTEIAELAFNGCPDIKSVTSTTVVSLGEFAFNDCPSLRTIKLTKLEKFVTNAVGSECRGLKKVYLPSLKMLKPKINIVMDHQRTKIYIPRSCSVDGFPVPDKNGSREKYEFEKKLLKISKGMFKTISNMTIKFIR